MALTQFLFRVGFVAMGIAAVGSCADGRAWTRVDSWYTGMPPGNTSTAVWVALPSDDVLEVSAAAQNRAQRELETEGWQPLSLEKARELTDDDIEVVADSQLYLVRAVVLNEATGGFSVSVSQLGLHVHHGSLGKAAAPMKRRALVVRLGAEPSALFVSCSMSE